MNFFYEIYNITHENIRHGTLYIYERNMKKKSNSDGSTEFKFHQ